MDFTLNIVPNQQAIYFVDETITSYTNLYNLPSKREICFVVHELVINAIEATNHANLDNVAKIQVHVSHDNETIKVTVVDQAKGIPEEDWNKYLHLNNIGVIFSDRGRGLLFVKNMVDDMWFEKVSDTHFLVGISKKYPCNVHAIRRN